MKKTKPTRRQFLSGMGMAAAVAALPLAKTIGPDIKRPSGLQEDKFADHFKFMSETKLKGKLPPGMLARVHRHLA